MTTLNKNARAFTLLEVLVAIMIVAVVVTSLIVSTSSLNSVNASGIDMSTAEFLVTEIRAITDQLPVLDPGGGPYVFGPEIGESTVAAYDDVDDFDDASFSPPIDYDRNALNDFAEFTQNVTVESVANNDPSQAVTDLSSNLVRVTVDIVKQGRTVTSTSWIRSR
jgi:prepilin-type N-terminal cleavage/methylation domain-containing protein